MRRLSKLLNLGKDKVSTFRENIILTNPTSYWPLNESSGTTAFDLSVNHKNALYSSNITLGQDGIGDQNTAVKFTGAASIAISGAVNLFNKSAGTFSINYKVAGSGTLVDAAARYIFYTNIDAQNTFFIRKQTTANQYAIVYLGQNVNKTISYTSTSLDWNNVTVTWSGGDSLRVWLNGNLQSPTLSGLAPLTGTISSFFLGATTLAGANRWDGYLQHAVLFDRKLPSADVAILTRRNGHVIFDGDSRTISSSFATSYPTVAMADSRIVAKSYGFYNSGISGQTIADFLADAATEVDSQYRAALNNIAVVFGGVNDANAGASVATIYDRLVSWCVLRRKAGFKVLICTEIDAQDTGRNAVSWSSTMYPALNTLIRNNWRVFADGLIDFGADSRLQDATNTTYFNADKVHPVAAGYAVMAGIATPELLKIM